MSDNQDSKPPEKRRGNPNWVKGVSGNPGGRSKDAAEFRRKLFECGDEIHEALMDLVRARNQPAITYAHQQMIGKAVQSLEVSGKDGQPIKLNLNRLSNDQLEALESALREPGQDGSSEPGGDTGGEST